jgi:hypothetical protein
MNIDFNINSTDINPTTITNFKAYKYYKEEYQIEEENFLVI